MSYTDEELRGIVRIEVSTRELALEVLASRETIKQLLDESEKLRAEIARKREVLKDCERASSFDEFAKVACPICDHSGTKHAPDCALAREIAP